MKKTVPSSSNRNRNRNRSGNGNGKRETGMRNSFIFQKPPPSPPSVPSFLPFSLSRLLVSTRLFHHFFLHQRIPSPLVSVHSLLSAPVTPSSPSFRRKKKRRRKKRQRKGKTEGGGGMREGREENAREKFLNSEHMSPLKTVPFPDIRCFSRPPP